MRTYNTNNSGIVFQGLFSNTGYNVRIKPVSSNTGFSFIVKQEEKKSKMKRKG